MDKILVERYLALDPGKYLPDPQSALSGGHRLARSMSRFLPASKEAAIVELGCGNGSFLGALKADGFRRTSGCDLCEPLVDYANHNGFSEVQHLGALEFLDTLTEPVDRIFMFDVIEHLELDVAMAVMRKVLEKLTPGGMFIGSTPNGDCPFGFYYSVADLTHRTIFTPRTFEFVAREVGFSTVTTEAMYLPGRWTGRVDRLLKAIAYPFYACQHYFFFFHWPPFINANMLFCATR